MSKSLEDFIKKYLNNKLIDNEPRSYSDYKMSSGIDTVGDFTKTVENLYATKKRGLASYGRNYRNLANKGLQNSGYASYISARALDNYDTGVSKASLARSKSEAELLGGYASYLEKYQSKQSSLKSKVTSHLTDTGELNLDDAIAYGIENGLNLENATAVGTATYSANKRRAFNSIIEEAASLGLDKEGAILLGKKMGLGDKDADELGEEIDELLKHYDSISEGYIKYLEENSQSNTRTFNKKG